MKREYRDPRPGEVSAYLSSHAEWMTSYGEELRFRPSPCCKHNNKKNPSAQIHSRTGLWRCFSCDNVGNFFTLTRDFDDPLPIEDRYKNTHYPIINIDWVKFFEKNAGRRPVTGNHYPSLLEYCHKRGISDEVLNKWKISSMGPNNIRIPIYQWDYSTNEWVMVNAKLRNCLNENANATSWFEVKGGPTGLLMGNHLLNIESPHKRAIICEGEIDAMTASMIGFDNVFSLPNGAAHIDTSQMLRYIPDDWEIWLFMDMDKQGDKAAEKFYAQLGPDKVKRLKIPIPEAYRHQDVHYKDLNEWYAAEDGFLTEKDIIDNLIGVSQDVKSDGLVGGDEFMTLQFDTNDKNDTSIICDTPWAKLNSILAGGFRSGQTTGILAPSGKGKTTWCNQIAIHAACLSTKVGLISLEGTRKALNNKIKDVITNAYDEVDYEHIVSNLVISNLEGVNVTSDQCIEQMKKMILKGCKLLIFDNLDFICRGDNDGKLNANAGLIDLAVKNSVHIIIAWQPNKVNRNAIVNSGNQKGYSQTLQDADNYFNFNKINGLNVLEVEKHRETGEPDDNKVKMKYDNASRSFIEYKEPESQNGVLVYLDNVANNC